MALTPEWRDRIIAWREELPRQFYEELGPVPLAGFVTTEQLRLREALARPFQAMPEGTAWGAKWEYAWFRGRVTVPECGAGRRIVLRANAGGESAIYVNGVSAGARDRQHHELTLTREAIPGATYDVAIEAYAGHGPRVAHAGPILPGARRCRSRRPPRQWWATPRSASGTRRSTSCGSTSRPSGVSARTSTRTRCAWPRSTRGCATLP